jgi:hypothetical protein
MRGPLLRASPIMALAIAFLMAGCNALKPASPAAAPGSDAPSVAAVDAVPKVPAATPPASAKSPAKAAAPPVAKAQPPKKDGPAPEAAKSKATPPLDLTSLETRLKETKGIGVLTKIALKNQVDDLLDQFRAFYKGVAKTTLADLRQPYDLLLLKVLSLLQDSDPALAAAIVGSREAIWGILADPEKFAKVSG